MMGLTQIMEWGWLESPILLTNSHSVGKVHSGVITYMAKKYPDLGTDSDVVLPVVGETDDSFLNDLRVGTCSAQDAIRAIEAAAPGPVAQGSIGAGVGMMTCDFAGGIGTSSRTFRIAEGTYTVGVLVLSNFGKMRNLTVEGSVVGRGLDALHAQDNRRTQSEGSIIVAFSTANRTPRPAATGDKFIRLKCISDAHINDVYEAVIEATEESVLNAIFCSNYAPASRCDQKAVA